MKRASRAILGGAAVCAALSLSACSASHGGISASGDPGTRIAVVLTNAGCTAKATTAPAGVVTFDVTSTGGGAVSELELQRSGRILAERENIAPGFTGSFRVTLQPGGYQLACPGGTGTGLQPFTVTAVRPAATPNATS